MITANAVGVTSAAHTPCIERNTHSSGIDDATAQRAEVSAEPGNANQEHALLTEYISKRAADQQQRPERQQVRVRHPLLARQTATEVASNRGQRDTGYSRV